MPDIVGALICWGDMAPNSTFLPSRAEGDPGKYKGNVNK